MNNSVSGESSAKGLSVILPYIAFDRADVAIRRPGHFINYRKTAVIYRKQPYGTNTLKRTYELRRRFVLSIHGSG